MKEYTHTIAIAEFVCHIGQCQQCLSGLPCFGRDRALYRAERACQKELLSSINDHLLPTLQGLRFDKNLQEDARKLRNDPGRDAFWQDAMTIKRPQERQKAAELANSRLPEIGTLVFEHIKHGDEEHQRWLKAKVEELFGVDLD